MIITSPVVPVGNSTIIVVFLPATASSGIITFISKSEPTITSIVLLTSDELYFSSPEYLTVILWVPLSKPGTGISITPPLSIETVILVLLSIITVILPVASSGTSTVILVFSPTRVSSGTVTFNS